MLDNFNRRFGRFGIPNLTLLLVVGQVFVVLAALIGMLDASRLVLDAKIALNGEPWRFVTFLFLPPPVGSKLGLMLLPFTWWLLYLMGDALEQEWGALRYNLFLLCGTALTVAAAVWPVPTFGLNTYQLLSIGLAFAWLNPDFELSLFFVAQVKMKWIALLIWLYFAYLIVVSAGPIRMQVSAAAVNFAIFFSREIYLSYRQGRRKVDRQMRRAAEEREGPQARHRCHVCGKTDVTNPEMDFRYCSKCAGDQCYCPEHIFKHEHVLTDSDETKD